MGHSYNFWENISRRKPKRIPNEIISRPQQMKRYKFELFREVNILLARGNSVRATMGQKVEHISKISFRLAEIPSS